MPTVELRAWQAKAVDAIAEWRNDTFLLTATPGAGKTVAAGEAARRICAQRNLGRVVIVCPTTALRRQWAQSMARHGFQLDYEFENSQGREASDYDGVVITYAQLAYAAPLFNMRASETLAVLDEVHHAGDQASWGSAVREAFHAAGFRLLLTGTPFRSDDRPIPFVRYEDGLSCADFTYGYGAAVRDGVCRRVSFSALGGRTHWRFGADEVQATFDDVLTRVDEARRLRTAFATANDWIADAIKRADAELDVKRRDSPDAGGLILAETQTHARQIGELLEDLTGHKPSLALSDDPHAHRAIGAFAASDRR